MAAVLLAVAGLLGYLNHRFLKLEPTVGMMLMALVGSLLLLLLDRAVPVLDLAGTVRRYLEQIDFNEALMHGMLGLLLFAGALNVDFGKLAQLKWTIAILATFGLLLSTALVGVGGWLIFRGLGLPVSLLACLVFGALISPTDPISVMGTLKSLRAPPTLEAKVAGESLFNDGVAVVVFTGLVALLPPAAAPGAVHGAAAGAARAAAGGHAALGAGGLALLFLRETGGGAALGLAAGYLVYRLMRSIDDPSTEVMLSLALVTGAYSLAWNVHVSAPIAVVCAGLLIGNRGRRLAMSDEVVDHLEKFWTLLDEILNAVLFLLIGIEILAIALGGRMLLAGALCVPLVLLARLISVGVPVGLMRRLRRFVPGTVRLLTWGGLRGGISVALVLSLPPIPEKPLLVACTYVVVAFSILVQGLTIGRAMRALLPADAAQVRR